MRERLRVFGLIAIFWLTFQVVIRAVFMIYNHHLSAELTPADIMRVFANGLKMDASITGYCMMLTGIILALTVFRTSRPMITTLNVLQTILLLLSSIIVAVDVELYRHWGFRLNTTPLFYAGPEALGSVEYTVILTLALLMVLLFSGAVFVYRSFIVPKLQQLRPSSQKKDVVVLILLSALMFIPVRGSFTVAPMNTGFVYFHKTNTFANHAAINVVWNFLYSLRKSTNHSYPENFFDNALADKYFRELYPASDSTVSVFSEEKPNIILFILESFTADVIEPLGGEKGVTPSLNELCKEGILFDQFYSSGDRTDKGLISILSGYPAQPLTSIVKYPGKTQRLPYLTHHLNRLGYTSSFVYGGDIDFANFRSYLTTCQFSHITTEDDFPDEWNQSKWGVHDHYVVDRAFAECDTATSPFFKVVLTLSSHEPFDVPMTSAFSGNDEASLFLNSCHYTDRSIGDFISKAKQSSWWKNTVVMFVADHGHRLPRHTVIREKERFRIPFLITGGAVRKDSVIHTLSGQTDIANTLLGQLGHPSGDFRFSKNILSIDTRPFAAYFFNDGYGFLTPEAYIIYDNTSNQLLRKTGAGEKEIEISKSYQQILYSDYNKR